MITEKTRRAKAREAKRRKEWHEAHMCYGCRPFRLKGLPAYWDYENHLAWMGGPQAGYTKNDLFFAGDVTLTKTES